jgi:activator of 2-hydroxyglutaryl-CoA dehydratase
MTFGARHPDVSVHLEVASSAGIVRRAAEGDLALVKRVPVEPDVVFVGGGALNDCLHALVSAGLGVEVRRPPSPQTAVALGAALHAARGAENGA